MSSPSQQTPHSVWNPKIYYYSHKSLILASVLSQMNTVYSASLRSILLLSCHECLGLPRGLLPSQFPTTTPYTFLVSLMCATCPAYLILFDLIPLIIFGKDINHKSLHRKFSLASCYFLLCRSKYLSTLFLHTFSASSFLNVTYQVPHSYKTTGKIAVT